MTVITTPLNTLIFLPLELLHESLNFQLDLQSYNKPLTWNLRNSWYDIITRYYLIQLTKFKIAWAFQKLSMRLLKITDLRIIKISLKINRLK